MKEIPLSGFKFATVDDDVYDWLSAYDWSCTGNDHPVRMVQRISVYMSRVITGVPHAYMVFTRNGSPLDLRRSNLRIRRPGGEWCPDDWPMSCRRTRFHGLIWRSDKGLWLAHVNSLKIGMFDSECEAARTYNIVVRDLGIDLPLNNLEYAYGTSEKA